MLFTFKSYRVFCLYAFRLASPVVLEINKRSNEHSMVFLDIRRNLISKNLQYRRFAFCIIHKKKSAGPQQITETNQNSSHYRLLPAVTGCMLRNGLARYATGHGRRLILFSWGGEKHGTINTHIHMHTYRKREGVRRVSTRRRLRRFRSVVLARLSWAGWGEAAGVHRPPKFGARRRSTEAFRSPRAAPGRRPKTDGWILLMACSSFVLVGQAG